MARAVLVAVLLGVLAVPAGGLAHAGRGRVVEVRIVADPDRELGLYRAHPRVRGEGRYFYVEAVKGERYRIRVRNVSAARIGVVIAVDGRSIITGEKSELRPTERMYILGPRETQTFEGWRTGMERTNRFYFTEPADSYAERAFADGSAMGTIALAVFRERLPAPALAPERESRMQEGGAAPGPAAESRAADRSESLKAGEQAGTGFGETTYSPVRIVQFDPEGTVAERIVMRYEWRAELCRKGVIACGPPNRLWPDDQQFAPLPPGFRG